MSCLIGLPLPFQAKRGERNPHLIAAPTRTHSYEWRGSSPICTVELSDGVIYCIFEQYSPSLAKSRWASGCIELPRKCCISELFFWATKEIYISLDVLHELTRKIFGSPTGGPMQGHINFLMMWKRERKMLLPHETTTSRVKQPLHDATSQPLYKLLLSCNS
jgi:hypothetical protein